MRHFLLSLVIVGVAVGQVAAVEVRLRDGTVLQADSYTLTGSYLMLTLADGRSVAYDLADVDLESLPSEEEEVAKEPAQRSSKALSTGRRKLAMPPEDDGSRGLAITDQDVKHVGETGAAAASSEEEEQPALPGGPPEGYESGGQVVINDLRVTPQGEGQWLVEGEVINRRTQPVLNVRVQLQTVAGRGEKPWGGEVAVASQLGADEKGVFSHSFAAAKPEGKETPSVRATVIWMEHQAAPEKPPAATAAPSTASAQGQVWF
jgi:hypothetical protein